MKRRAFLKTAGVLSAPLVWLPSSFPLWSESKSLPASDESWEISNHQQRIVVASRHGSVTYQSFVYDEEHGWRDGSIADNQFVSGAGFQLTVDSGLVAKSETDSAIKLAGKGRAFAVGLAARSVVRRRVLCSDGDCILWVVGASCGLA